MGTATFVDLYELTMAQSYLRQGLDGEATFAYFVRAPVPHRRFLLFAGLDPLLDALEGFRFEDGDLRYLDSLGLFDRSFLDHLAGLRFTGEVEAMREGEVVFPGEPLSSS